MGKRGEARLDDAAFAKTMLPTIGYTYSRQDAKKLGKKTLIISLPFVLEWFRCKGYRFLLQFAAMKAAFILVKLEMKREFMSRSEQSDQQIQKPGQGKQDQLAAILESELFSCRDDGFSRLSTGPH